MAKELFVSSSPHETKVAVLEDDQLVEVYYEREADTGLVGGIYKGRVSRVLPGMQSAFVNIGLERDAFLYVSDFVEDEEEYDKIFSDAEARATKFVETGQSAVTPPAPPPVTEAPAPSTDQAAATEATAPASPAPLPAQPSAGVAQPVPGASSTAGELSAGPPAAPPPPISRPMEPREFRRHDPRGRRPRRGGRRDFRPASKPETYDRPPIDSGFEILPGESLAKYRGAGVPRAEAGGAAESAAQSETVQTPAATASELQPGVAGGAQAIGSEAETGMIPPSPMEEAAEATPQAEATGIFTPSQLAPSDQTPTEPAAGPAPESVLPPAPVASEVPVEVVDQDSTVIFSPVNVFLPTEAPSTEPQSIERESGEASLTPSMEEDGKSQTPADLADGPEVHAPAEATGEGPEPAEAEFPESGDEGEAAEADAALQEQAEPREVISATTGEAPQEPSEKKYTLREPYQRPRFAPRRRRGRRGMGRRPERPEPSRPGNTQPVQISDVLKEGQEIIVQIAKEPLGTKGARITSHIALPGRYLVFMPTINHIGVSRKIASEEERLRLRNIILENRGSLTGGFIVRTAGAGRSEEEFKTDLRFLSTLWNEIRSKAERTKAPALLHRDLDLVQRILRDILSPDFKQVRVDNELEYERCVEFVNRCQPSLVGHVKLYTRDTPLFEEFGIQQEVDKALKPKVWLKSGGYIVINQTEALVAIDVNTGKYVGKTNRLEDTIVKTNVDAVNEIVRQIRLRDLGGIIVIDFIDMDERKNRMKVVQALEEALRRDRAPTKVLSFNDFGLVAVTRKRVKQSLERTLSQPCGYCGGSGWVKSVTTVCYEIVGEVKKMARQLEGDSITLRVNPDVAQALKSRQGALLSELEAITRKDVIVKGDPTVHQERFEIY
jgi:Rne/Rng family ribonuclease